MVRDPVDLVQVLRRRNPTADEGGFEDGLSVGSARPVSHPGLGVHIIYCCLVTDSATGGSVPNCTPCVSAAFCVVSGGSPVPAPGAVVISLPGSSPRRESLPRDPLLRPISAGGSEATSQWRRLVGRTDQYHGAEGTTLVYESPSPSLFQGPTA